MLYSSDVRFVKESFLCLGSFLMNCFKNLIQNRAGCISQTIGANGFYSLQCSERSVHESNWISLRRFSSQWLVWTIVFQCSVIEMRLRTTTRIVKLRRTLRKHPRHYSSLHVIKRNLLVCLRLFRREWIKQLHTISPYAQMRKKQKGLWDAESAVMNGLRSRFRAPLCNHI